MIPSSKKINDKNWAEISETNIDIPRIVGVCQGFCSPLGPLIENIFSVLDNNKSDSI